MHDDAKASMKDNVFMDQGGGTMTTLGDVHWRNYIFSNGVMAL